MRLLASLALEKETRLELSKGRLLRDLSRLYGTFQARGEEQLGILRFVSNFTLGAETTGRQVLREGVLFLEILTEEVASFRIDPGEGDAFSDSERSHSYGEENPSKLWLIQALILLAQLSTTNEMMIFWSTRQDMLEVATLNPLRNHSLKLMSFSSQCHVP